MKSVFLIVAAFLAVTAASPVSWSSDFVNKFLEVMNAESLEDHQEQQEGMPEEMPMEIMEDNTNIMGNPSADYRKEVEEYLHHPQLQSTVVSQQITAAIKHGDTIALQSFVANFWLGCAGARCGRASCPRMLMMGSDWKNCWGEVFEIYRAGGPGVVRVGDLVGLHYPRQRGHWLGCAGNNYCTKATCPGIPTNAHGFAHEEQWYRCYGEVFKIYARGKKSGSCINSNDRVALYYLQQGVWVAQGYHHYTLKLPCLGKSRPPALHMYDGCVYETFQVWKRE